MRPTTTTACGNFMGMRLNRRAVLSAGVLSFMGWKLPQAVLQAAPTPRPGKASAVIFLHQFGGPSHHDTVDMKPNAPDKVRGEFRPMPSSLPGLPVCEHLPRLAQWMNRATLIRSLTHEMKNHNSAAYYSLSGYPPPTDDQRLRDSLELFPAYGAIVDKLAPAQAGMPTFVMYPYRMRDGSISPGQHASFLGKQHDPLFIGEDPNRADFRLPELTLPNAVTLERLENRRRITQLIDQQSRVLESSALARTIDTYQARALAMLSSPRVRAAFDLEREPPKLRDRYGRTTFGQSCLLARRLVEAGVKFVNVHFAETIGGGGNFGGWDTHGNNGKKMYPILKEYLLPITDQALPALLGDLEERGLLDKTLVVWVGEFGRTPRINDQAGRDHWPQCYSGLLFGGGVKRGYLHGSSDQFGAYPAGDPVRPEDLAATMFALLGLDPHTEIRDALNRPLPIAKGTAIDAIMA